MTLEAFLATHAAQASRFANRLAVECLSRSTPDDRIELFADSVKQDIATTASELLPVENVEPTHLWAKVAIRVRWSRIVEPLVLADAAVEAYRKAHAV